MSMQGNAGSSAAAEDLINYIKTFIEQNSISPGSESYEALMSISKYAQEIKEAADSGWY